MLLGEIPAVLKELQSSRVAQASPEDAPKVAKENANVEIGRSLVEDASDSKRRQIHEQIAHAAKKAWDQYLDLRKPDEGENLRVTQPETDKLRQAASKRDGENDVNVQEMSKMITKVNGEYPRLAAFVDQLMGTVKSVHRQLDKPLPDAAEEAMEGGTRYGNSIRSLARTLGTFQGEIRQLRNDVVMHEKNQMRYIRQGVHSALPGGEGAPPQPTPEWAAGRTAGPLNLRAP